MQSYGEALLGFKRGFLIIGLTGFTGCGCSTSGLILKSDKKPELPPIEDLDKRPSLFEKTDPIDYAKLSATWQGLPWSKFQVLEVGRIIFMFAIYHSLRPRYSKAALATIRRLAMPYQQDLKGINSLIEHRKDPNDIGVAKQIVAAYEQTKPIYAQFRANFSKLGEFIVTMQDFGDNIRRWSPNPKRSRRIQTRQHLYLARNNETSHEGLHGSNRNDEPRNRRF